MNGIGMLKRAGVITLLTLLEALLLAGAALADTVSYVDENGVEQTRDDVTVLTDNTVDELKSGWYALDGEIEFDDEISLKKVRGSSDPLRRCEEYHQEEGDRGRQRRNVADLWPGERDRHPSTRMPSRSSPRRRRTLRRRRSP